MILYFRLFFFFVSIYINVGCQLCAVKELPFNIPGDENILGFLKKFLHHVI